MKRNSHIKTHFDSRVVLSFVTILLISGVILAFRINESEPCLVGNIEIEGTYKAGELIIFSDHTLNAHDWKWNFGDGEEVASRSKVAHEYTKPGKYLVNLWVNKNCNITKMVEIQPKKDIIDSTLLPRFHAPQIAYVGEPVIFTDSTSHAKSWEWRFGESEGRKIDAIDKNPSYTFSTPGKKTVFLLVNDDINYISKKEITVLPAREEKTDFTMAGILQDNRRDIVEEQLRRRYSDAPPPITMDNNPAVPMKKSEQPEDKIEVPALDEDKLAGLIMGVANNVLTYNNFKKYFCKDYLPQVQLRDGRVVSLYYLNNTIRDKKIELKSVSIVRNRENNCVSFITVNYKKKGLF